MTLHYAPTTPEEEELAIALALSASLASAGKAGPSSQRSGSLTSKPAQPSQGALGPSSSGSQHAPPAPSHPAPKAGAVPTTTQPNHAASSGHHSPPASTLPLPPGISSPPHIFPVRMPLPQLPPRQPPAAVPPRQGSHPPQRLSATLPGTSTAPHPNSPNRNGPSVSPQRGRFTWGGTGSGSGSSSPKAAPVALGSISAGGASSYSGNPHASTSARGGGASSSSHHPGHHHEPHMPAAPAPPLPPIGRSGSGSGPSGASRGGAASNGGGGSGSCNSSGGGAAAALPGGATAVGSRATGGGVPSSSSGGAGGRSAGGTSSCGGCTPPPRVGTAAPASPPSPPAPQLYADPNACAGCGRGFGLFGSDCITGMGRKWHSGCFKCGFCSEPISSGRGSFSYNMQPGDPRPYHPDCYRHAHHPVCNVCGTFIPAGPDGRISYRENGFWRERYCTSHGEDALTRCCACSRLQKQGEEWAPLPDGRHLCLQCLSGTVLDTREAQPLYEEVLRFYAEEMRLAHPYKPPLLLVDGPTLNEHAAAEGRDDSADGPVFHVRGLCVAQVYSHIPAILRGQGGGLRSVATPLSPAGSPSPASSSSSSSRAPQRAHCHVSVLLLLYGLPRLLSGSIMAHELMHAWLRMAGLVGLPLRVEEGLCQLMACLWLDRQHELLQGEPEEQRLASFFSYQIRTDTSEVYGEGFRDAMEAFQTYGLTAMIHNLKTYGTFAPP